MRVEKFVEEVKACNISKTDVIAILENVWNEEKGRDEE